VATSFVSKTAWLSLDASVIDLCVSLFDWAQFQRTKGAIKLHLLLDHAGYLPSFAVVTAGKTADLTVARQLALEPGTVLVLDRGYIDYRWFVALSRRQVYFVTRLKENAVYDVVERRAVPQRSHVIADEVIFFPSQAETSKEYFFRRVEIDDPEQGRLVFLTNHHKLGATTVAAIYKDRWQVELFFKALKQNLRIKTFVGTSANAVRTQVWTALIAMLLLRYLQLRAKFGWSLSNLAALLRQQLFVHRDLWQWLDEPFQPPPGLPQTAIEQLALPWAARR
jgi:IS4 transposase